MLRRFRPNRLLLVLAMAFVLILTRPLFLGLASPRASATVAEPAGQGLVVAPTPITYQLFAVSSSSVSQGFPYQFWARATNTDLLNSASVTLNFWLTDPGGSAPIAPSS